MGIFVFVMRLLAAVFIGNLLGVFGFWGASYVLDIQTAPDIREPFMLAVVAASSAASIGSLIGFRIGPKAFEGSYGAG